MVAPAGTLRFPKQEPRRSHYGEAPVAATATVTVAPGGTIGVFVYL